VFQTQDPMQQFALEYTISKLSRGRTAEALTSCLNKLHRMVDFGDPASPCATCRAGSVPVVLASELLPIQAYIATLGSDAKGKLAESAEQYKMDTLRFRDGRLFESMAACPFAGEEGCRIHPVRPFGTRFTGDPAADTQIRAIGIGHAIGIALSGLDHTQIELGLSLPRLLSDPDISARYLEGDRVLWEAALIPPGPDPIREEAKRLQGVREGTGFPEDLPSVAQCQQSIRQVDFDRALSMLHGDAPLEQLYRIQTPYAYESEDEITEWLDYFVRTMREVSQKRFDPADAFDALKARPVYSLPYCGRDITEILAEHGRTIVEPIVARAFPDLVTPIDGKRRPGPVRVGYLSNNIRFNNGSTWALGWLKNHGPEIESYVFATHETEDEWNIKFREAGDHYFHVPGDVPATARLIKNLDLDVLIFTDIGQVPWNYMYAGMRLARTQCSAWGFPVTSGLSTIDYYLSSELMEPANGDEHYVEKLVRLPGSGLYLEPPSVRKTNKTRADFGLPDGFLVGMLQNLMKCVPKWDFLFERINEATGRPVFLAEHSNPAVNHKVSRRMARAGIQIEWLPRRPAEEFFEMVQLFDVLIDTPAWSGGITTLDTIPLGTPLVTLPGEFMRGRLSSAFLTQANMTGFIASSPEDFVQKTASPELHRSVLANGNVEGPFRDKSAANAVNAWLTEIASLN
jgi:hypothetical protein